ncbi:IS110 family transposase [Rhodopseudomonas palustris]|uniref:IS110 family transposase n=1 Tax=Rhodopseudomonas palustris TaxID=1076 RepID=UPI0021F2B080|nr:IS110 family transposase [Rhodopseudomonas palustris]UYO53083.1 IS110 family transposase [Rhodopseudomonas palustris]UYO53362.1 IS110 family transposase [Rhodopseudomonas palustris]UYO53415.1 IS110 family transposase [Rhodopseudomonas palustris]UYO54051.1 IS110 family transposase [Rhodopseudomonas palustris]UYO54221.1 IS110 family transposase [Rhodopseudomonas palustris]
MTIAVPLAVAAGVDAGQRFLDVALAPSGQTFRMPNLAEGIAEIIARLERSGVRRVVLEAIGPYAEPLVKALSVAGFEVGIVNPRRIKAFREAEGGRAKTDRLDARLIARFALTMPETLRPLPTDTQLELKALSLRRRQLTEMIAMEKTRMKQVRGTLLLDSHRAAIAALSAQCQAIEAELAKRIGDDAELRRVLHILKSIPGIGERVATLLITDLPELGQRDRKAIASLAGLAPHVSQSGAAPPRAAIAGGRPCVRAALYMAALVAARHHPKLRDDYNALRLQGKPGKVALIAIARKLLVTANALVKADTPYQGKTLDT